MILPYEKVKIYSDGSHYIGIPHTTKPKKDRISEFEESIAVYMNDESNLEEGTTLFELVDKSENAPFSVEDEAVEQVIDDTVNEEKKAQDEPKTKKKRSKKNMTRKEMFETLYTKYKGFKKKKRRKAIIEEMLPLFKFRELAEEYVDKHIERKERNLISRRVRFYRKACLTEFNYFVTFTYDDKRHTEASFKKKLKSTLSSYASRRGWKYAGVWERGTQNRLHFHGLFYIPEGTLPGNGLEVVKDYSVKQKRVQTTLQNDYFRKHFGRNDFVEIFQKERMGESVAYIMKYIEKTGEKIMYSKGLPQYFVSDILEEDVVCPYGIEDKKLLLFDDFSCWEDGVYVGTVSQDTIAQMPKANT